MWLEWGSEQTGVAPAWQEGFNMPEDVQCAVPAGDICGEGAVWHPDQNALYWADINRFLVHRFDPSTGAANTWMFREPVTAVNLTADSELLLLVMGSRIALWSPRTHPEIQTIYYLASTPEMRFNDARIDPRGWLWAGTMRNNVGPRGEQVDVNYADGVLMRIGPGGDVSEWKTGVGISNTLAWSPDEKRFYFGDSHANTIYSFDYDMAMGTITAERTHITGYPHGLPDGSAMDAQGCLWNARYGGGCLIRIDPNGQVDKAVALPTLNPTTCAFGGPDLRTLYITSARSQDQLSGSVFSMRAEVGGVPEHRFQLR
jgi:sugar lactone lactonase YvrE